MLKKLRGLFVFTRKEKNGIFVLLVLIAILIMINLMLPSFIKHQQVDTSKWEAEVDQFYAQNNTIENRAANIPVTEISQFNPNSVSSEYLVKIGFPEKVASNFVKYVEKGGHFKSKNDVKKIYGLKPELYDRIAPYLVFAEVDNHSEVTNKPSNSKTGFYSSENNIAEEKPDKSISKIEVVELNGSDSLKLLSVPGIGPVLSSRIIKYRKMLGGYYAVEQLHEVYGLKDEHFNMASAHLRVDAKAIIRFNINFASVSELGKHPYIGFKTAKRIVKQRDEKGKYGSAEQLGAILSADSLNRLLPYLIFNE
jgi:DNA uptake protein ComE-like DNA-binding protein